MASLAAKKKADHDFEYGGFDKLFKKHINVSFAEDLQLAFRAAAFIIVCALPFLVPRTYCPLCYEVVRTRFYNSASVVYFCFTLYKTTGDTIYFAYGGLMGTVIAVTNIWALMGFMPGGYQPGQPNAYAIFWLINLWGAVFVFFMLYLNLDGNTRVFGLTTFVWYWMAALNHHVVTGFAHNFEIKLNGGAMGELCCAASGCFIAIIASCVPTPLLATYKMNDTGKFLVRKLHSVWSDFIDYYTGEEKNPYSQNVLGKDLASLQGGAGTLAPYIKASWFECFGMGGANRRRLMMRMLDTYLSECFNRLSCVLSACLAEEFDDTHDALMKRTRAKMTEVCEKIGELLSTCEDVIIACGWDDESKKLAEGLKEDLNKTVDEMTKEFLKAAKELNLYQVSDSIAGEFLVGSNLCCWARITCEFCDKLQGELPAEKTDWTAGGGFLGMFAPGINNTPENLNYVLRGWVSVMIAFTIGFNGVAGKMVKNYNAALASTICVLLSKSVGGALQANLMRLQGVVLGTVIGQVAYALLAWCVWWGYLSVTAFVYCWSLLTMYMYYHSDNYSTVGLLLSIFANGAMLQGCSDEIFDPTIAYHGIINTVSGITIMATMDIILAPDRSSNMAMIAYQKASEPLSVMADELFDAKVTALAPRKGAIRGLIAAAEGMNNQASLEPRFWREVWPRSTYAAGCNALTALRFNMATIDYALVDVSGDERPKAPHFIASSKMTEFEELRLKFKARLHFIQDQMAKCLEHEQMVDVFAEDYEVEAALTSTSEEDQMREQLKVWAVAVSKNPDVLKEEEDTKSTFSSLEDDPIADMCILYGCMENMIAQLETAHEALAGA